MSHILLCLWFLLINGEIDEVENYSIYVLQALGIVKSMVRKTLTLTCFSLSLFDIY